MKPSQNRKKVSIRTFGCQMNAYDTEVAEGLLEAAGFSVLREEEGVSAHAKPEAEADIVLINTCSVREHAEDRVFGRLGLLGKMKLERPDLVIGLLGCMVEEHREALFERFPQLDLMVGTRNIKELPDLVGEVLRSRSQVAKIKRDGLSIEYTDLIRRRSPFHSWLPIMTGCDKVCTFCIVPKTRGSEVSMPADEVCREAARLASDGAKWITLLGQNVNSYRGEGRLDDGSSINFSMLLDRLCRIEGIKRISFTTSHPSDATPELFETIARNPKISRRFHLPLQSGSDRILKRMKRLHTYEDFKAKVSVLRSLVPGISLTTDIIAGFPGEAAEDYAATGRALEEIRFDGAYIYKYSCREGTSAAKLKDDVPQAVKEDRNRELISLQRRISAENNRRLIGVETGVFAERVSAKNPDELSGRTDQEKKVVFKAPAEMLGTFCRVRVLGLKHETLTGELSRTGNA